MYKLDKPKLEFSVIDKIGTIFGIIASIFSNYLFDLKTAIIVFLSIALIILLYVLYRYKKDTNLFYSNYEKSYNKFCTLENRYNIRIDEIKNKEVIISEYEKIIDSLNIFIITCLTNNSSTETEQLKNMQSLLYLSIEHLNKLKGVNNNGGNLQNSKNNWFREHCY